MRGARGWIVAGVLAVALVAVVLFNQQAATSGDHSSNSDAADGTSALLLYDSALGHPTDQLAGSYTLPAPTGLMFVFTPTSAFSSDEAANTVTWVRGGGVLVYASEGGDEALDSAFGVNRKQVIVSGAAALPGRRASHQTRPPTMPCPASSLAGACLRVGSRRQR